jgi:hypothetical protein
MRSRLSNIFSQALQTLSTYRAREALENAAFIAAMEEVLEVHTRSYDQQRPLVCVDEIANLGNIFRRS